MISHGNLTEAVRAILAVPGVRDRVLAGDACSLFFLPLSHILARVVSLCLVHAGKQVGYPPDTGQLPAALAAFRLTIVLGVPRVFDKLVSAARQQAEAGRRQRLFAAAQAAAIACSRAASRPRLALRLRHAVFARAVYPRLRQAIGGRVAWAISGGAPLSPDLAHFLRGAGIPPPHLQPRRPCWSPPACPRMCLPACTTCAPRVRSPARGRSARRWRCCRRCGCCCRRHVEPASCTR